VRGQREKTDEKDALDLLELLRGHMLAGNRLPTVWIPDAKTRDDRELVRMRLEVVEKITAVKAQIQSLLKRYQLQRLPGLGKGWTQAFRGWLQRELADPPGGGESPLGAGGRAALSSLLRHLQFLEEEEKRLDQLVAALAWSPRYESQMRELTKLGGVGVLTAIVFLTELGDLSRFANRRQIAAYLGLAPSSHESGEQGERKGHITRQGSRRVRKVLCQATWSRVRCNEKEKAVYQRIKAKNPKKGKIAVVASMRRLAVRMWHQGRQAKAPGSLPLAATGQVGRGISRGATGRSRRPTAVRNATRGQRR
jgi:transposase